MPTGEVFKTLCQADRILSSKGMTQKQQFNMYETLKAVNAYLELEFNTFSIGYIF